MSKPVAIVTGAASGIGLAVTKHLLSRGYRVAMADIDSKEGERLAVELGPEVMFQQTDVSVYAQQAALFARAFAWGGKRLDFLAANAGIADKQSLYAVDETLDGEGVPKELDLSTLRVDLDAVFQGVWLFKHYARKSKPESSSESTSKIGGKVVITSSAAGLYPMESNPQYTAAKHALVGLTRSAGSAFVSSPSPSLPITVNCICPAFVPTNLCPPHMLNMFPKEHITPMSTVLKAFDSFLDDDNMTGQTVELSLDQLYFRKQPDWANESQRWLGTESKDFWDEAYKDLLQGKGQTGA